MPKSAPNVIIRHYRGNWYFILGGIVHGYWNSRETAATGLLIEQRRPLARRKPVRSTARGGRV